MPKHEYDTRHGGPFDRGGADAYYQRPKKPHKYKGDTGRGDPITDLTPEEIDAYNFGYDNNEAGTKDWG